jgi:D-alanyl-D-alanine carboxypeptidase
MARLTSTLTPLALALTFACGDTASRVPQDSRDVSTDTLDTSSVPDTAPDASDSVEAPDSADSPDTPDLLDPGPWDAQSLDAPDADATTATRLQAALEAALSTSRANVGVVAVQKGNDFVWTGTAIRDRSIGRLPRADRPFRIGSVTKTYVALVVLALVANDELDLDATIDTWFPELAFADTMTVTDLLAHTSGVGDYFDSFTLARSFAANPLQPFTFDALYAAILDAPPAFEPGAQWAYNNSNYILLGEVARRVADLPFAALLATHVSSPLGLTAIGYEPEEAPSGLLIPGHSELFGTPPNVPVHRLYDPSIASTAGAMFGSAPDLAKTFLALGRGYLPDPTLRPSWLTAHDPSPDFDYGLGVMVFDVGAGPAPGPFALGHNGSIWGYDCIALVIPEADLAVVAMVDHDDASSSELAIAILDALGAR